MCGEVDRDRVDEPSVLTLRFFALFAGHGQQVARHDARLHRPEGRRLECVGEAE